jgi:hypothetical protein
VKYHCEAYDEEGKRFGGFVIEAVDMPQALAKAAGNIEVKIRPEMYELRVHQLSEPVVCPVDCKVL